MLDSLKTITSEHGEAMSEIAWDRSTIEAYRFFIANQWLTNECLEDFKSHMDKANLYRQRRLDIDEAERINALQDRD